MKGTIVKNKLLTLTAISLLMICGIIFASSLPVIQSPDLTTLPIYKVVRVVDGDTFSATNGKEKTKIRLIGVDTPETVHPNKPVEAYGIEASRFLKNLLKGEEVYLKITSKDKYGRTLAYVYRCPDGLFVNAEIIRQGYGHAYTKFPFEYMEQFRQLEKFARDNQKGLWSDAQPVKEKTTKQQENEEIVYITKSGTKYHKQGCRFLSETQTSIQKSEAVERGCSACLVCNP